MDGNLLNVSLTDVTAFLGAVAALGMAAAGLVDTTKIFGGGISNFGFGRVHKVLRDHFAAALDTAAGARQWRETLRGAWLNGMAMDDQIAKAKALVMLGLTVTTAEKMTLPKSIDRKRLSDIATAMDQGAQLTVDQQVEFNRFDACVGAMLRGAYQRGDQVYRNAARAAAGAVAILLAVAGGAILNGSVTSRMDYLFGDKFWLACIVGAVAVPLAPIAKDLASSLQAAVKAMQSAGG